MKLLYITLLALGVSACCAKKAAETPSAPEPAPVLNPIERRPIMPPKQNASNLPKAYIYKVSNEYADHVTATVVDGRLVSYPAPSDITESTAPMQLKDGWWLDRSGINQNSVYLKWTRAEYRALPSTPTPAEILDAVIPGARPAQLTQLPISAAEAAADTAAVNRLIGHPSTFTLTR